MTERKYLLIYRRGGTLNATWHRTMIVGDLNSRMMQRHIAEMTIAGHRTMTVPYEQTLRLGLPEGYGPLGEVTTAEINQARRTLATL